MGRKKQPLPVYFVKEDSGAAWLTLADITEEELTEEQKALVAAFEELAETYTRQVESLDSQLVGDYHKLLKKHKDKTDNAIKSILDETLHQLIMRKYSPGYRKHKWNKTRPEQ